MLGFIDVTGAFTYTRLDAGTVDLLMISTLRNINPMIEVIRRDLSARPIETD